MTPCAVAFGANDADDVNVGDAAKQTAARNPGNVVYSGNKSVLADDAEDAFTYDLESGRKVKPKTVHKHVAKYMHDIATSHAVEDDFPVALTIPHHFDEAQAAKFATFAEEVGFEVVQVISEEAAACVAYGLERDKAEDVNVVVFRAGGRSVTCSVVEIVAGCVHVKGAFTDVSLGGGDRITQIVADFLAEEFMRKHKADPRETKKGQRKLKVHAETVKHVLSTLDTAGCYVESLYDGIDFNCNVSRGRFDNAIAKAVGEYVDFVRGCLDKVGVEAKAVNKVVFCGGTSKIPKLQKAIGAIFEDAELLNTLNPDEIIAIGAAHQASLMAYEGEDDEDWKVRPLRPEIHVLNTALRYKVDDVGDALNLVSAKTPIPVRRSQTIDVSGNAVNVSVYNESALLAKLSLTGLDENAAKVHLSLHIHRDFSIHLGLTDKASGKSDDVKITPNSTSNGN